MLARAALIEIDLGMAARVPPDAADPRAALLSALVSESPVETVRLLEREPLSGLDAFETGLFLRTLGRAQAALDQRLPAASNLALAERYPMPPPRRTELALDLWQTLQRADRVGLEKSLHPKAPNTQGWLALLDLKPWSAVEKPGLAAALETWQQEFPNHPARQALVEELLAEVDQRTERPRRIALLLPNSGPLAKVAAAIRDGLLAARYADSGEARAEVLLFDAGREDLNGVLAEIRNAGADLIIGPLAKDQVDALAASNELPAPVLALNSTGKAVPNPNQFVQFALRPEDEAVDVANRAWHDGARRVAVLVSNSSVGSRQLQAFSARWEALGGSVVGEVRFNRSASAYAEATSALYGLAESKARAGALRTALRRDIAFEAVPRDDIDAVFVAGSVHDAHQLLPQFRYVGADRVAVYGGPGILEGLRDTRADRDLDGLRAGGTAWAAAHPVAFELREAFARYWNATADLQRFHAFGVDAWMLASRWGELRAREGTRVEGVTGTLSVDETGTVRRSLYWAEVRDGKARALEHADLAAP